MNYCDCKIGLCQGKQSSRCAFKHAKSKSILLSDWNELDNEHKKFVLRVHHSNGCKHGAEPSSIDSNIRCEPPNEEYFKGINLWEKTEESGFIECVGSYKWATTDKYKNLINELLEIK